eukprot:Phypoly_transcript_13904.p1 GENE.Phypoly_transcript_13904~~Phypoly_transcript_13904.p1  ORF type:complete len:215 (+),score=11.73 Phypoly_transcript_13904:43-687(+)
MALFLFQSSNEMLTSVVRCLPLPSVISLFSVSKALRERVDNQRVWASLFDRDFKCELTQVRTKCAQLKNDWKALYRHFNSNKLYLTLQISPTKLKHTEVVKISIQLINASRHGIRFAGDTGLYLASLESSARLEFNNDKPLYLKGTYSYVTDAAAWRNIGNEVGLTLPRNDILRLNANRKVPVYACVQHINYRETSQYWAGKIRSNSIYVEFPI